MNTKNNQSDSDSKTQLEYHKEKFTATINEITHGHCDCCMKGFNHKNEYGQCKCWCSNCGSLYADCKANCYESDSDSEKN